jgi:hypothetical protein
VGALLSVRWTVELSGHTPKDVERLARTIADSGRGVVYDPQADAIVWPRKPAKLRAVETSRDTSSDDPTLHLRWEFARRLTSDDAHTLLAVLRSSMPEAVPVRFGEYEPMQGRLERDGDDAFAALWDGSDMPFWKGRRPFDWGFVFLQRGLGIALPPHEREPPGPDELLLEFALTVCDDPRWLAAIESLFARVGEALNAFYGAAHHEQAKLSLDGGQWLGLPPEAPWLTWLGDAYREAAGAPPLTRAADRPDDLKAKRSRIAWPEELMRRGDRAAAVIPRLESGP